MEDDRDITELQKLHQMQMKEKREKLRQRKARTHRLIVRGAIAESLIPNAESMTDMEFQQALYRAVDIGAVEPSYPQDSVGRPLRENPSEDTS